MKKNLRIVSAAAAALLAVAPVAATAMPVNAALNNVTLGGSSSERAANPVDLLEYADVEVKEAIGDPVEALKRGHELTNNDELLICAGSLYLIGYLREQLL